MGKSKKRLRRRKKIERIGGERSGKRGNWECAENDPGVIL
jgi:hypothetical protein